MTTPFLLDARGVVSVTGPDAATFLNGLLTCETASLSAGDRRAGALLTPQGKILCDLLLERTADGFLIDCNVAQRDALIKRLVLFRLRAAVEIAARDDLGVIVFDGPPDPRSPAMPHRRIAARSDAAAGLADAYHAARIAAGVAEQGVDYGADEVFPADVNLDLIGAVDFKKGCFVGQEVVSRMKRRGTARRRTLQLKLSATPQTTPCPVIAAGGAEIGQLTSFCGKLGLARLRIDRLGDAQNGLRVEGEAAEVVEPIWLADQLRALETAQAARS